MIIRPLLAVLVLAAFAAVAPSASAAAQEHRTFRGCIVERAAESLTLGLGGGEMVTIGTAWLSPDDISAAAVDCVTIMAVRQPNGTYMAESIEAGDEPNEVNSLTEETTRDREAQHEPDDDDD